MSLDEAWGFSENFLTEDIQSRATVSAQQTVVREKVESKQDIVKNEVMSVKNEEIKEIFNDFLTELSTMRQEQTRRFIVLLVVAGLIAAFLFMYIDRLQSKLHRMNQAVHRLYWQRSARRSQAEIFDEVLSQNLSP